jgi:hypothetical protein
MPIWATLIPVNPMASVPGTRRINLTLNIVVLQNNATIRAMIIPLISNFTPPFPLELDTTATPIMRTGVPTITNRPITSTLVITKIIVVTRG